MDWQANRSLFHKSVTPYGYDSRIVIFDLPPVLNSDDAMVLLPQVDCVLLVVANGTSKQAEIEETMHHIPKEKLVGVLLNKAETESRAYYYWANV